ncbi:hypothetical protein [Moraxella equi]|uniref:Mu-like prophage FluMu protein gp28 n=1 Tax=Moraxella equi TaxID=60442 RepID=A0A378QTX9_9GAMM|nr:hypothetical protein [Moraxella equi]STZ02833.1 Mu-like prophage FluMu protein gp28 [Moraxella equi]
MEDAKFRYEVGRVEGVIFSSSTKLVLATTGKQAFEDKQVRILMGDTALRADLHKLKKVTSPTGTPRFIAESDNSGHSDRAWALFWLYYMEQAMMQAQCEYLAETLKRKANSPKDFK